jgi:hypothetical protein
MHTLSRIVIGSFLALGFPHTRAAAAPIAVVNPGFEANFVSPGCFAVFHPTGWQPYDPFGILDTTQDVIGALNTSDGPYFPEAPEGDNVGLVFLQGDVGGGEAGMLQVLTATLQPNTIYRLSVEVGDIDSGTGLPPCDQFGFFNLENFPGYRVELLAGGEVIAVDDNTLAATLADAVFLATAIRAVIPASHVQLGQPLEIRLINLNVAETPEEPGIEVDFDAVALEATAVNLANLAALGECLGGPDAPSTCPAELQGAFDLDDDGDLDLADYLAATRLQGD